MSGKMGFNEFKELGMALNGWKQNFMTFDADRSGTMDGLELHRAVATMGEYEGICAEMALRHWSWAPTLSKRDRFLSS